MASNKYLLNQPQAGMSISQTTNTMKKSILILALAGVGAIAPAVFADDYVDDIYYNPKKDSPEAKMKKKAEENAKKNYIANFDRMDVDDYNRRGQQYYLSPIDTVGMEAASGEDFVYTQEIQKFYNPTIVVDNAGVLADVLSNSYGNVTIEIDDYGYPYFSPYAYTYYPGGWGSPYWGGWYGPGYYGPSWSIGWGWGGWGVNLGWYDPWYGPGWGWGYPSYGWGWGPGWGPGWGHPGGPGWGHDHHWAQNHYRPNGNNRNPVSGGWASNRGSSSAGSGSVTTGSYVGGTGNHRGQTTSVTHTGSYSRPSTTGTATTRLSNGATRRGSTTSGTVRPSSGSSRQTGTVRQGSGTSRGSSTGTTRSSSSGNSNRNGSYRSSSSGSSWGGSSHSSGGTSRGSSGGSSGSSRSGGRR